MSQSREVISSSALDQMTAGQRLAKARSAHLSPHSKKPELPATAHSQRANSGITKLLGPARGPKHLRCTMDYTSGDFGELDSSRLVMMETGELARWIERQRDMTMFHLLNSKALLEARCLSSAISLLLLLGLASVMGCKRDPSAQAEEAFARAQDLLKQNKPEAAIIELSRAIQAKPDLAKAHHDLAKLYFARGDINGSFREYSLAVRYNPQDQEAYHVMGEVLLTAREFAKAKDTASQILNRWPDDRRAKYLLAESMMGLGDWEKARKLVEQNAAEEPEGARAQFDLAALLIHDKKWPAAEQQLRLSWRLDPKVLLTP